MKRMIPRTRAGAGLLAACLTLAACGVTYTSPRVSNQLEGVAVREVLLTAQTVLMANKTTPYTPRSLPQAFYQTAGTGGGLRFAERLPEQPVVPDVAPEPLELRAPPQVMPPPYRIGVGDVVTLVTRNSGSENDLSGLLATQNRREGYTVRDDGAISIPDIGPVRIAGLSLKDAEAALFDALIARQIDPAFSLDVAEFNSKRVAVGGRVASPRIVPVALSPLTLGEAITAAGGINMRDREYASIRIYRTGDLYQIPLEDYLRRPDLQRLNLLNGDAVYVDTSYDLDRALKFYRERIDVISLNRQARADALTELDLEVDLRRSQLEETRDNFQDRVKLDAEGRDYIYLGGEFRNNARIPLPYNQQLKLTDALFSQGGYSTRTADASHIYVLRSSTHPEEFGAVTAWHLDARNPAALAVAARMEMRPDDIVFIQEQPITSWGRALDQFLPSLLNAGLDAAS